MKNKSKNIRVENVVDIDKKIEYYNLYSYNVYVCCVSFSINTGELLGVTLGKYWDFSITTTKHIYDFLRDFDIDINNKNVVENAIENGFLFDKNNDVKIPFFYDGGME